MQLGVRGAAVAAAAASIQTAPAKPCKKWADSHGSAERSGPWFFSGSRLGAALHTAGTLAILSTFPIIAIYLWHIVEQCDGSILAFVQSILKDGNSYLAAAYPQPSWTGLKYIGVFGVIQAALLALLPGRRYHGPVTPKGNVPEYKANGTQSFLATLGIFFAAWRLQLFDPAAAYDHMGTIISTSNLFSLFLCSLLYLKGRFAPSSSDSGTTGSILFDFYWGYELYPRIGRHFDIKTWVNCRMGMMSWAILPLCYAAKQYQLYGHLSNSLLVSVVLMEVYVFKFFLWETGYWSSMDIAHDRAGFYTQWGCLVWVPSVYTSPAMYLVRRPHDYPPLVAGAMLALGLLMIYFNYDCDRQRQVFRQSEGKALIWGKTPRQIKAYYTTGDSHTKTSLLLVSGWWGLARHIGYAFELATAFMWSCPAGFGAALPYLYLAFLTGLLTDRAYRDDAKCGSKYGVYWQKYCSMVPWKVLPYVW